LLEQPAGAVVISDRKNFFRFVGAAWGGLVGLYDSDGMLRFTGRDPVDCQAYAELFGLEQAEYSIESMESIGQEG